MIINGKLTDVVMTMKLAKVSLETVLGTLDELLDMFEHTQRIEKENIFLKKKIDEGRNING